jgi:hypothetical protein
VSRCGPSALSRSTYHERHNPERRHRRRFDIRTGPRAGFRARPCIGPGTRSNAASPAGFRSSADGGSHVGTRVRNNGGPGGDTGIIDAGGHGRVIFAGVSGRPGGDTRIIDASGHGRVIFAGVSGRPGGSSRDRDTRRTDNDTGARNTG